MTLLSVIIPLYNENKTIVKILEKINSVNVDKEIIVVDDKSSDMSKHLVKLVMNRLSNIILIERQIHSGRSQSIYEGIKIAKGDIIILQDADLEYDPQDYLKLIEPIINGETGVTFGSRITGNEGYKVNKLYAIFGLKLLNRIQNFLYKTNYTDCCTCYIAMKKEIWKRIDISKTKNFTLNATITSSLAKLKISFLEVPISYSPRTWNEGKKVNIIRDGIEHILTLITIKFKRSNSIKPTLRIIGDEL